MATKKSGFAMEEGKDFDDGYLFFSTKCPMGTKPDPASTSEKPLPDVPKYDSPEEHINGWIWEDYARAMEHGRDMLKVQAASAYDGDLNALRKDLA